MTGKSEQCSKCCLLSICLFNSLFNQSNYVWNNTALNFRMIVLPLVHSLKQLKLVINREELQNEIRNSIHTQTKNKPSIQAEMCLCRASFKRDLFSPSFITEGCHAVISLLQIKTYCQLSEP